MLAASKTPQILITNLSILKKRWLINVGLIGIGTVGGGTWTVLKRNADEIARRAGRPIRITAVADKNVELAKQITGGAARVADECFFAGQ